MAMRQCYGRRWRDLGLGLYRWTGQPQRLVWYFGIRRMDRVTKEWIKELCRVMKGVDEKIDKGVLQLFGHVERRENDMIVKRVYVGECAGGRSVGRQRKRWIDTLKEYLRKRGLDVWQARRMVHDSCK